MPRRKPERVEEVRITLGDFERDQIRDLKMIEAAKAAAPAIGLAAIGAGIALGAAMFGKGLDELKEWWGGQFKADKKTLDATQKATTDTPAVLTFGDEGGMFEVESDHQFSGMSPAAIYDVVTNARGRLQWQQFRRWCESTGRSETGAEWEFFKSNSTGLLAQYIRVSTAPVNDSISPFTYQLMIRETAARRVQGISAGFFTGFFTGGVGFLSPLLWAIGNGINPNEWTSVDVRDAPGYVVDPLLSLAWGRTNFPGTDATSAAGVGVIASDAMSPVTGRSNPALGNDFEWDQSYEMGIVEEMARQNSDPTDLDEWWP